MFQALLALVILTIGDHKKHALVQLSALFQMIGRSCDRIVKRRPAARVDLLQRLAHLAQVGREVLIEIVLIIEVDDEHLILCVTRLHKIDGRLVHLIPLFPHRPRIVDHDPHGYRNILTPERNNGLRPPVLKHREGLFVEVRHQALLVIHHGGMQHHFLHPLRKDERTFFLIGSR